MGSFFKVFFACLLAILVAGFLATMVLVGLAGILKTSDKPVVKSNTILVLDISQRIAEQGIVEEFDPVSFSFQNHPGLQDIISAIDHARGDSLVKALYLKGRRNSLGFAASQELGEALDRFTAAGKKVVAFTDMMPQRVYEVFHHASEVYVQPGGLVEWAGLYVEVMFFKNLLDRLYIKPEIFYAGQFKSATEPFRLNKMSEPNRLQYRALIEDIYNSLAQSIQQHRGVDSAKLNEVANNMQVQTAEQALEKGLIDEMLYEDGVRERLKTIAGQKKVADISFMKLADYYEATRKYKSGNRIAVVYADGSIVDGKGEEKDIASDKYRNILEELRADDKVKAVVLRVNSPGGSAIASEVIWRELELMKKEKPVVVSMGNYAASGGYYISCGADSIFAQPNTLTGSIGVFTIMMDAGKMFNDKLGINFDGVGTHQYADYGNIARPLSPLEKQVTQQSIDSIYSTFKSRVASGRKLSPATVDSLAQGRVWSGTDALANKLVDQLGGLKEAVACAARMAKLDDYTLREFPKHTNLFERLLGKSDEPEASSMRVIEKQLLPQHAGWLREYRSLSSMVNIPQARLPFVLQYP